MRVEKVALFWVFSHHALSTHITCPPEIKITIPPDTMPWEPPALIGSMSDLNPVLSECKNIVALDLRIAYIGCTGNPDRWSLPLDPSGPSHYPSQIQSLSIEGYKFDDQEGGYVQPPSLISDSSPSWIDSEGVQKAFKWRRRVSAGNGTLNIDLWLGSMNFSSIHTLVIKDASIEDGDLLAPRLSHHMSSLRSLSVEGESIKPLVFSFPAESLKRLSWVDTGGSDRFDLVAQHYGKSLLDLEWRTPEYLRHRRPMLSLEQLRNLRTTLPNITALTLDINRGINETWPWEELVALSVGLPDGVTNIILYLEIASECRRELDDDWRFDPCSTPCIPSEQFARPLLTVETALELVDFLQAGKVGEPLRFLTFRVGDWTRPWDGPLSLPDWLDGRQAWVDCTVADDTKEVSCSGKDIEISPGELRYCDYIYWHCNPLQINLPTAAVSVDSLVTGLCGV
jgi:hypothetical protein